MVFRFFVNGIQVFCDYGIRTTAVQIVSVLQATLFSLSVVLCLSEDKST